MADIEIEGDIRLPATLSGGAGIKITRNGVDYIVDLSAEEFSEILSPTTADRFVLIWNEGDQVFERVAFSELVLDPAVAGAIPGLQASVATNGAGLKLNRIVNPAFQISQEFGADAAQTVTAGQVKYICDQWLLSNIAGGTLIASQSTLTAPSGSRYRFGVAVTAADATVAAAEYVVLHHYLEGFAISDLLWGTAAAKSVTLRFVLNVPVAGTYGISLANSGSTHTYVTTVVVAAGEVNTDKLFTLTIPGPTVGVWATGNAIGIGVRFALMAGANYQTATVNAWQAGNYLSTAAQVNNVATTAGGCSLADVGLYEGTVAPAFVVPNYADELRRCMRYFEKMKVVTSSNLATYAPAFPWRVNKRATPSLSVVFDSSTGGVYSNTDADAFYQSTAHGVIGGATVTGNARL
jgi:hypothetical protein